MLKRSSGILLHPTSLPGRHPVGGFGPVALNWIDTLAAMKQSWWQILPLGPTGFSHSPYQSYSAFAGNVLLLSPEWLIEDQLADAAMLSTAGDSPATADFLAAELIARSCIAEAWQRFRAGKSAIRAQEFDEFRETQQSWLHDYARFMAIRGHLVGQALFQWPEELRTRDPAAVQAMDRTLDEEIRLIEFGQFLFERQWRRVRGHAAAKHIGIIGDIPIFVAADSADVWTHPELFLLDDDGRLTVQSGVPPDYFSDDGQLWGNPIYNWAAMANDGYRWWIDRVRRMMTQADLIRLDHFRGFVQAWHVPAADATAKNGNWVDGPGRALFDAIEAAVDTLPFIAEDLGVITPDVVELRETLGLPGMTVLQFMPGDARNIHQPHNFTRNAVCYTGTHDNDTTIGWHAALAPHDRDFLARYLGTGIADPSHALIRLAWSSVARIAIAPLQDVLSLGSEARMNVPSVADGNWTWRVRQEQFSDRIIQWIAEITLLYGREP